jgi:hypothetical protein
MQLRDRAEGTGPDVHGAEGDQGRGKEVNLFFLKVTCPVCKAKVDEKCFDLRGDKRRRIQWDEAVHWRRERKAVDTVVRRLTGK